MFDVDYELKVLKRIVEIDTDVMKKTGYVECARILREEAEAIGLGVEVYDSKDYAGDGIYLGKGGNFQQIYSGNAASPSLFDGNIAFVADGSLLFYDGNDITTIATNNVHDPCLYEDSIVYHAYDGNDFEIYVARSVPVPEPSTALLFGSGLFAIGIQRKVFSWLRKFGVS